MSPDGYPESRFLEETGFLVRHVTIDCGCRSPHNQDTFTWFRNLSRLPLMHRLLPDSGQSPLRRVSQVLLLVVLAALAGCSVRAYEERLDRTNKLFGYMNTLNENLQSNTWGDTYGFGIRMRPPKPFALILPPPAPTEENPAPVDDRHPGFLPGINELPGLIGAWQAELSTTDGNAVFAFMYVMGNQQRFLDMLTGEGGGPEPAEYLNDLEAMLQFSVLGHNNPLEEQNSGSEDNKWYQDRIPRDPRVEGFPTPKEFRAISFLPREERVEQFLGRRLRLQLYEYVPPDSNVQLAVLMVYPVNVEVDPVVRLRLALETLEMSEQAPRPQQTGEAAGGGAAPAF